MIKLVVGDRVHRLTWRDGCFVGGFVLGVGGLWASFGTGVAVAIFGGLLASVPFFSVETPQVEPPA